VKYYIAIDNGVTGSCAVLDEDGQCLEYWPTPVEKTLNYTKVVAYISRVRGDILLERLRPYVENATVVIERPLVNPQMFKATVSAIRCDEATRTILEMLKVKFIYVDSKQWQKEMLPSRTAIPRLPKDATAMEKKERKAKANAFKLETKSLSLSVAQQLFPSVTFKKDGDAILMCEWSRRNKL